VNKTLAGLLESRNHAEVARRVGTGRNAVNRWAHGIGVPQAQRLPALAKVLGISIVELTRIVANDTKRIRAASVSDRDAA
jgi:transcriptional regulator with XRE-family HTH domain